MKKYFFLLVSFILMVLSFGSERNLVLAENTEFSQETYQDIESLLNDEDHHFCIGSNYSGDRFILYKYDCETEIYNALEKEDTFNDILEYVGEKYPYYGIVIQMKEGT